MCGFYGHKIGYLGKIGFGAFMGTMLAQPRLSVGPLLVQKMKVSANWAAGQTCQVRRYNHPRVVGST